MHPRQDFRLRRLLSLNADDSISEKGGKVKDFSENLKNLMHREESLPRSPRETAGEGNQMITSASRR